MPRKKDEQESQAAAESVGVKAGESAEPSEAGGEGVALDLSPVIQKPEEEEVPFEVVATDPQPGSRIDAKVKVQESDFEKRLETILKDLRKNVVVDGFRRGHAPLRMLRNIYGKDAQKEAVEKMKDSLVRRLAKEREWSVVGEGEVKDYSAEPGRPLEITYSFEILPKVEVTDDLLRSIAVEVEHKDIDEARVDEELEKLRRSNATYEAKSAEASFEPDHDGVAVDVFVVDAKGRNVAELSRMDEFLENPKSALPEEVVNALTGKKTGDHVDVTIPAHAEEGERREGPSGDLVYHVEVKGLKTLRLPALDDEFAKDVGEQYTSLESLRKGIRKDLEQQAEDKRRSDSVEAVFKAVLEKNPIEVPQSLVMATAASRIERQEQMLRQYGLQLSRVLGDRVDRFVESAKQDAEFAVKTNLVVRALADREKLAVTEEDLEKEFQRLGEKAGRSALAMRANYEARKQVDALRGSLLQRKVEDIVLERATVTYKSPAVSPVPPAEKKTRKSAKPKKQSPAE